MMNTRALALGLLVALGIHVWLLWPARQPSAIDSAAAEPAPVQPIAVRQLDEAPQETAQELSPKQPEALEELASDNVQPSSKVDVATAADQPERTERADVPAPPEPMPASAPPTQSAAATTQVAQAPSVPDSGPAQVFGPLAATEAIIESTPIEDAAAQSETASASEVFPMPSAQVAVAAPREPGPPPLPPPPVMPPPQLPPPVPQTQQVTSEVATRTVPAGSRAVPSAPPALRLRSRSMRSWDRDDMLESLPKPDPAFLSATDPRSREPEPRPYSHSTLTHPTASVQMADAGTPARPVATPEATSRGTPAPYKPVSFESSRERARGQGAQAADRGYLKSLGPVPQDPVARIAWGDTSTAMRTMSLGRMALVIVDDDLKVVASIDGSSGSWVRGGLPQHMSTYSNRVRVVDHVSAFAAFAPFCQPHEHLAVLVPVGLERRIESAMDVAARAQGLARTQVAACYGRLETRNGALEFIIDRVERRSNT